MQLFPVRSFRLLSCLLVTLLVISINSFCQDYKSKYRTAKEFYANGKYAEALDAFQGLVIYDKNNPFSEHASFYMGLTAQKLGYTLLARQTFVQLIKLYPTWQNIDEARYQLVCIYLKQKDYFLGIKELNEIKDPTLRAESLNVEKFYISKIEDVETLKLLIEEFPQDVVLAKQVVSAITANGYTKEYKGLLDSLSKVLGLHPPKYSSKPLAEKRREVFRVSLLFPFLLSSLDAAPVKKKNQFVLELYQGMKLAVDSLQRKGILIELLAYDTERNLDTLKKILRYEELTRSDLLVGPLFTEEIRLVNEFSMAHKIPVINPVTSNEDFLGNNMFAMLFQPSFKTIGQKVAEFCNTKKRKRTCAVLSGENAKDTVMANSFIKSAKGMGIKIVLAETITKEKTATIQNTLASPTEYDKWSNPTEFSLKRNSLGCIYVTSDNPLIYSKVINSVQTRNDSILVIGSEAWLKDNSVDYAIYERLGVLFTAPNFTSPDDQAYINFRNAFIEAHGNFPAFYDNYAKIGFSFIFFLGAVIGDKSDDFLEAVKSKEAIPSVFAERYLFKGANNNVNVPLIRFSNGQLEHAEAN